MEAVECRVRHVHRLEQPRPQLPERRALHLAVCSRLSACSRLAARRPALDSAASLRRAEEVLDSALDSGAAPQQPEACSELAQAAHPMWLSLRTQPRREHPRRAEVRRTGRRQSESAAVDAWTRTSSC